jgi:hypothetical protein
MYFAMHILKSHIADMKECTLQIFISINFIQDVDDQSPLPLVSYLILCSVNAAAICIIQLQSRRNQRRRSRVPKWLVGAAAVGVAGLLRVVVQWNSVAVWALAMAEERA